MSKIVVLLKRKPSVSVEEFQHRWWENRGARIAARRQVRRYVQSHPLASAYRNGVPACDGFEELWFDDEGAERDYLCEQANEDKAEESLPAGSILTMAVGEVVVTDGVPPPGSVKSVILAQRKTGMTRRAFFDHWHHQHAEIAGRLPKLRRYEQNPMRDPADGSYDGVSLAWFDSFDDLKAITRTPEYALALQDETNFLEYGGRLPIVLTQEHVLVDG